MKIKRLFLFSLLAIVLIVSVSIPTKSQFKLLNGTYELIAGRNVNMVGGSDPVTEVPYDIGLQRQNEPWIVASARNPMHLIAAANDWRPVEMDVVGEELPGVHQGIPATDAWMGIYKSINGGESFYCEFLPGSPVELNEFNSPIYGYDAVADPVLASGAGGLVVGGGITFNRGQRGEGALFAFRYLDRNNQEAGDPWIHVDQQILDLGDPGHFIDKEWVIVDRPRTTEMVQLPTGDLVPKFNVFMVYTSFAGDTEADAHGKLMLAMSHDSGNTWTTPTQITDAGMPYQAACMTIDQRNGRLHIAYRRFAKDEHTDAIMLLSQKPPNKYDEEIGYSHDKIKFGKPVVVAEIDPFDQATTPTTFRTNTYPSITSDHKGMLYIVNAERNELNYSEIMLRVHDPDTGTWGGPFIIGGEDVYPYEGHPGHKFQPVICYNQGYITIAWLDQRYDDSVLKHGNPNGYGYYVQKDFMPFRRTIDVRAIQFEPFDIGDNPAFPQSIQVSKYPWLFLFDDQGWPEEAVQLLNFKPTLELFAQNSSAFIGDYIGLAGAAHFVPDGNGGWKYNTEKVKNPVFHVAWADNRDVLNLDNLLNFSLPGSGCNDPNATGTRNQNVYTSRLTRGIIAGSPGNTKPLNIKRAFVILIRNTTEFARSLHLTINAPAGVNAMFREIGQAETETADITVLPYSSYAATVVIYPNDDEYASVTVQVWEGGVLLSEVVLNPDRYTPWIEEPDVDYTTPHVAADNEIHTPHVAAYQIIQWSTEDANPHVAAPHVAAPHVAALSINDDVVTPHVAAPHVAAYSPDILNPHVAATTVDNLYDDSDITDVSIDVENRGNTTSAYAVSSLPANLPDGVLAQLLVYRVHTTTSAQGCDLVLEEHHELLVNSLNPHVAAPHVAAVTPELSFRTGTAEPEDFVDAKFALKPQEKAIVVYRFIDKHTEDDEVFYPEVMELEISPDTPDIKDGEEQQYVSLPLIIETSARLPNGTVGVSYPNVQLVASGGVIPYEWSVAPDSDPLPDWLALDSEGWLYATQNTPQADGPYKFRIQVTDNFGVLPDEHATSSKDFYITVLPDNSIEISGWARDVGGTGLEGVAIEFSGRAGVALTDESGFYSHRVPPDWTETNAGTSKAYLRGYLAEPPQRIYTNLNADVTNQDFVLYNPDIHVMISGRVTEDIGGTSTPVEGVEIDFAPGTSATTNANGYYTYFAPLNYSGTATPSLAGYTFSPQSRSYSNITTNQTSENYAVVVGELVAYYPFNGNANDESGNGNHGTVSGATLVDDISGNPNSAYYFDGIDDVITAQERNFVANNSFSISLLVKIPGSTATTSYFIEGNGFGVWQSGVDVGLAIHLPSTNSAGGAVTSGEWQHFVGTYDGNTIRAYINGSLVDATSWPGTADDSDWQLMFGGRNDGVSFWEGYLDEVRIYNTVLDITEIEALYGTYAGAIAYYPFNGNADDASGYGNHGIVNGAVLTQDRFGNAQSAYSFDGTDDTIEIPDSESFDFSYPLTISAWIYLNDNTKGGIVGQWGYGGAGGDAFTLYVRNTKLSTYLPRIGDAGHYEMQSNASLATGQWYHVCLVSTGSLVTLYIDGEYDHSETVTIRQVDSYQTVLIGLENRFYGSLNYLDGIIDDVRIYNLALDSNQVEALYDPNSGSASYEFALEWGGPGAGDGEFDFPVGIAVDSNDNVYVSDHYNKRVQKFDANGNFITKWGSSGTGDGEFVAPLGIAVDSNGNVFVLDGGNNRVQKFDSVDGINYAYVSQWGTSGSGDGEFSGINGITVDTAGYVYVADCGNNRVQKFDFNGNFITKWGSYGTGDGEFNLMLDVAVDSSGNVYVADARNNRIQKFR